VTDRTLAPTTLHVLVLGQKSQEGIPSFVPKQTFRLKHPKSKKNEKKHHIICIRGKNIPKSTSGPSISIPPPSSPPLGDIVLMSPDVLLATSSLDEEPEKKQHKHQSHEKTQWIWYQYETPIHGLTGLI
jgi:hypothetical protein